MKTTYSIKGMTCNGCRSSVEQTIASIPDVLKVEVSLDQEEACIKSNKILDIAILRNVLPSKYTVALKSPSKSEVNELNLSYNREEPVSKWRQLKPLFMILGYIAAASVMLHRNSWDWSQMMLTFMGLFYIVFSFFKLLDLKGFTQSFAMYDPLASRVRGYAWIYPFVEVGLGLMLLLRWQLEIALVLTIVILGITTIGVTRTLLKKDAIQCACLGTALKLPMTEATFIENAIMLVMALSMLFIH